MRKNITMCKYIKSNYKNINIEIIDIDEYSCTYKCLICGAIKTNTLNSMRRQLKETSNLHTEACSKYFNDIIKCELNEKQLNQFRAFYRYAKERCCNPNSKDYIRYKDKFKFNDYTEYVNSCYNLYKKAYDIYGENNLSVDRIDNSKGYEKDNIRFVPMSINAENKEKIYPVMAVNIITKEIIESKSLTRLANEYFDGKHTSLYQSIEQNRLYLNTWKIFYTIET
ncbi:hypothetical protein [Romboutsia sp.]|uniref:hypothetical protein n=1 Tax=Romboutsia sp. TaxID=1965302 RepID=UPI003F319E1F